MEITKRLLPVLAIVLFLFIRTVWSIHAVNWPQPETITAPDSHEYLVLADRLLRGEQWHLPHRLPLYPLFLAVVKLLGIKSLQAISILQFVVVWVVAGICFWKSGKTAGIVLSALWTGAITLSVFILAEGVAICLVALATLLTHSALHNPHNRTLALISGLVWSLATLTRGFLLVIPTITIPAVASAFCRQACNKFTGWFLAGLCIPLTVWLIHNRLTWDRWFFSTVEEFNLLWYHASAIIAESESKPLTEVQDSLWQTMLIKHQTLWKENWIDFYRECGREALRIITSHPLLALKNIAIYGVPLLVKPPYGWTLQQIGLPYTPISKISSLHDLSWWVWLWLAGDVLVNLWCVLSVVWMMWRWRRLSPELKILLIASIGGMTALVLAGGAPLICDSRLRLPLEALWLTTAAIWLAKTWDRKSAPA